MSKHSFRFPLVAAAVVSLCVIPSRLDSDALIITKAMTATTVAEIWVEEGSIKVELEIGVQDLQGFRNLVPDSIYERLGHEPKPLETRLAQFFREDLTFRVGDGTPLPGRVEEMVARRRLRRDEITGEPLPVVEEDGGDVFAPGHVLCRKGGG